MPGIPREVIERTLNIKPAKQLLRHFNEEKRKVIGEEIVIRHLEWLTNPVLVKKKNGKWRMCVNYTSLNKTSPKDPFPLLGIDQVIDLTAGSESLCFMDVYSGYHQIAMKESDQLATAFITPFG